MTKIIEADLNNPQHLDDFLTVLDAYATDIMGGGEALPDVVMSTLGPKLTERNDSLVFLAYTDGQLSGFCNCFEGFSTFKAKPLLNIHDFAVMPPFRGKGVAKALLEKAEKVSRERDYCKMTLEVLEGNARARKIYADFGFAGYELDKTMGSALFLEKELK